MLNRARQTAARHIPTLLKVRLFASPFKTARSAILTLGLMLGASACTTTSPSRPTEPLPPVPIIIHPTSPTSGPETPSEPNSTGQTETTQPVTPSPTEGTGPTVGGELYLNNRKGLTPPHMRGRDVKRLALLLPFSTDSSRLAQEAQSMYRAAELAVFSRASADIVLIALDTKGTEDGARSATKAAIKSGADVILGPIIAANVKSAAKEARRSDTPVIAFSNDQTVAGDGTYLLSFPPESEITRLVDYVASTGATRFAYLGPDSTYGNRVKSAYVTRVERLGGDITASETYRGNDISVMQAPAQKLASFYAEGERRNKNSASTSLGLPPEPQSYEAILLPEGGTALRSLAPLLPYYGVDPSEVQFMGTSRWADPDTVREPALSRGIFAGPDKAARQPFLDAYDQTYGETASSLASLAYDAVMFGAFVADGNPRERNMRAQTIDGFYGVDGLVRFGADGQPERGLAVYQIQNGRFIVADPAPRTVPGDS